MLSKPTPEELEKRLAQYFAELVGSKVEQNEFGNFVTVSPAIAYEFSVFTGAAYCTNADFPFSAKPFSKIFGKAMDFRFTSSMFDRGEQRYSFENLDLKYPFISVGDKRVFFKAYSNELDLKQFRARLCEEDPLHNDTLIARIEYWKSGFGLEPLLEYSAARALIGQGYIVENQTPLSSKLGSPDFLAFKSHELQKELSEALLFPYGFSLASVNAHHQLNWPKSTDGAFSTQESLVVVGEAKVGGSKATGQIQKYLDSGFFDMALFLTDSCSQKGNSSYLELCTDNFRRQLSIPKFGSTKRSKDGHAYEAWLSTVTLSHVFFAAPKRVQDKLLSKLGNGESSITVPRIIQNVGAKKFIAMIKSVYT
jgi:hypothetical protein